MKDCILEKHKIHAFSWVLNVVFPQIFCEFLGQIIKIVNSKIFLLSVAIITKDNLFDIGLLPFKLEVVGKIALNHIEEPRPVLFINQSIIKDTFRLMHPQT